MSTYCFKCPECEDRVESPWSVGLGGLAAIICTDCGVEMRRDYRAEGANINRENLRAR